jgi:hypothetical protein
MESYLQGLISIETFLEAMAEAELIKIESANVELERIKSDTFKPTAKVNPEEATPTNQDNRVTGAASTETNNSANRKPNVQ